MSIERLSLELPSGETAAEAERAAARVLEVNAVTGSSDLALQTTLAAETPGRTRYTFTYWADDPDHRQ